ncbi:MAG: DMT family transporter [Johnsonella sp.]|nr:DMT family transporter [Johnsonella sp.]
MSNKRKAIILMLLSTFSFSLMQLIVKISGKRIPTMEQIFFRNLITLAVSAALILKGKALFLGKKENRPALLARSVFGYIGVAGYFYATRNMNITDASLLHRSSPFFVIIFSALFLKNRLDRTKIIALIGAFCGAVLIINPSFNMEAFPAFIAILSAAGAGGAYVVISSLKGKENNATIIFYFSAVSCILSLIIGYGDFIFPSARDWLALLGIGLFAGLGQILLTQAYKMTEPGGISIINYSGIFFSAILGFIFLQERIGFRTLAGGALILSAALLLFITKQKK